MKVDYIEFVQNQLLFDKIIQNGSSIDFFIAQINDSRWRVLFE